jgi:hypothetical protein
MACHTAQPGWEEAEKHACLSLVSPIAERPVVVLWVVVQRPRQVLHRWKRRCALPDDLDAIIVQVLILMSLLLILPLLLVGARACGGNRTCLGLRCITRGGAGGCAISLRIEER